MAREDATYAGAFNLIGGQTGLDIAYSDPPAEFTTKTSPGLWRELMDGGTVRTLTVGGQGHVVDDAESDALYAAVMGGSARHQSLAVLMPGFGALAADWHVERYAVAGELNQPSGYDLRATATGDVTLVPAVRNRYELQSNIVLDFESDSYWRAGVHSTAVQSLAGVTYSRTGTALYPAGWDFSNGGIVDGALVEFAANVPRTGVKGYLPERATTNEIDNPRGVGATLGTLGSGGVLPTGWTALYAGGAIEVVALLADADGNAGVRLRFSGTFSGEMFMLMRAASAVPANNSTLANWVISGGMELNAGADPGGVRMVVAGYQGGTFKEYDRSPVKTLDGNHRRHFYAATLAHADTDSMRPMFYLGSDLGAVDFTVDLYDWQVEAGTTPTSPVRPASGQTGAATRGADSLTVSLASIHNSAAWSLFLDVIGTRNPTLDYAATLYDTAQNDYAALYVNTAGLQLFGVESSVTELAADAGGDAFSAGVSRQVVWLFGDEDSYVLESSGAAGVASADLGESPNPYDTLRVGGGLATANNFSAFIKRLWLAPRRFGDDEAEYILESY